jgi:hypothetical protein
MNKEVALAMIFLFGFLFVADIPAGSKSPLDFCPACAKERTKGKHTMNASRTEF